MKCGWGLFSRWIVKSFSKLWNLWWWRSYFRAKDDNVYHIWSQQMCLYLHIRLAFDLTQSMDHFRWMRVFCTKDFRSHQINLHLLKEIADCGCQTIDSLWGGNAITFVRFADHFVDLWKCINKMVLLHFHLTLNHRYISSHTNVC